jgi:hypothetical protein
MVGERPGREQPGHAAADHDDPAFRTPGTCCHVHLTSPTALTGHDKARALGV